MRDAGKAGGKEGSTSPAGREGTCERIQSVALDCFRRQGFEATSLREIGEALSISKAAVYYHFASKDDLLVAIVEPFLADAEELAGGGFASEGPAPFLRRYLEILVTHHAVVGFLASDLSALDRPAVGQRVLTMRLGVLAALTSGQKDLASQVRAECALGALDAAASRFADELEGLAEVVFAAALAALGDIAPPKNTTPPKKRRRSGASSPN